VHFVLTETEGKEKEIQLRRTTLQNRREGKRDFSTDKKKFQPLQIGKAVIYSSYLWDLIHSLTL